MKDKDTTLQDMPIVKTPDHKSIPEWRIIMIRRINTTHGEQEPFTKRVKAQIANVIEYAKE